ncbi:MAG TPA: hypothetical protein VFV38_01695 [Ktedonobacteraceae bacterium]|nr:hypothetical protein [Ktedonobacteraceae bacterium]
MNTSLSRFSSLTPDLLAALAQPFPAQQIELRVGTHEQRGQCWMCQAIPFVPRRYYEDRLNFLVPGRWKSTTPFLRETAGRMVIAAQVQIFEVAHTDYAERPLRPSAVMEENEVVAPDAHAAFEYAFAGACACFGMGRYLADLERRWVPYDSRHRCMHLSSSDQLELVLTLYRQARIPLTLPWSGQLLLSYPGWPPIEQGRSPREIARERQVDDIAARLRARDVQWVRERCDQIALQRIYTHFSVSRLEELTDRQLLGVINGIHAHTATLKESA